MSDEKQIPERKSRRRRLTPRERHALVDVVVTSEILSAPSLRQGIAYKRLVWISPCRPLELNEITGGGELPATSSGFRWMTLIHVIESDETSKCNKVFQAHGLSIS